MTLEILLTLLGLCVVGMVFTLLMMFRNDWVYRERCKLIERASKESRRRIDHGDLDFMRAWDEYENEYLSYDEMLHRFWIWNVEKLRRRK